MQKTKDVTCAWDILESQGHSSLTTFLFSGSLQWIQYSFPSFPEVLLEALKTSKDKFLLIQIEPRIDYLVKSISVSSNSTTQFKLHLVLISFAAWIVPELTACTLFWSRPQCCQSSDSINYKYIFSIDNAALLNIALKYYNTIGSDSLLSLYDVLKFVMYLTTYL